MPPRFKFDREKSRAVKHKRGVSVKEAQETFDQVYLIDQRTAIRNGFAQWDGAAVTFAR
jgi:uncharacterized DUF497 family protein